MDPAFTIVAAAGSSSNAVLDAGIARFTNTLHAAARNSSGAAGGTQRAAALRQLRVSIEQPGTTSLSFSPASAGLGAGSTNYSHELTIEANSATAELTARTAFGALYGLESFAQLIASQTDVNKGLLRLSGSAVRMVDAPMYVGKHL